MINKLKLRELKKFVLILTGMLIYGSLISISDAYKSSCENNGNPSYEFVKCKILPAISYPSKIIVKGMREVNNLITLGKLERLSAYNSAESKRRFSSYNPGFNFNYSKGSRGKSGFLLLSNANPKNNGKPNIELWDLNNQKILKKWNLKKAIKLITKLEGSVSYFNHPIIANDNSIIFSTPSDGGYLLKVSSEGDVIGLNDQYEFHHSLNFDNKGLIYACISDKKLKTYREGFAILDANLNILETHFIDDIYDSHKLKPRIYSSNSQDPVHINDVQPIIKGNADDTDSVLISLKNNSSIIEYNFKSNNIAWIMDGFTSEQHDVDIVKNNPLEISIFNNNLQTLEGKIKKVENNEILFAKGFKKPKNSRDKLIYNYSPSTVDNYPKLSLRKEDFKNLSQNLIPKTMYGGLHEFNKYENSIIIEEENHGRIFEYDMKSKRIMWSYINSDSKKERFFRLMWSRFYEENPLLKSF